MGWQTGMYCVEKKIHRCNAIKSQVFPENHASGFKWHLIKAQVSISISLHVAWKCEALICINNFPLNISRWLHLWAPFINIKGMQSHAPTTHLLCTDRQTLSIGKSTMKIVLWMCWSCKVYKGSSQKSTRLKICHNKFLKAFKRVVVVIITINHCYYKKWNSD